MAPICHHSKPQLTWRMGSLKREKQAQSSSEWRTVQRAVSMSEATEVMLIFLPMS